MTWEYTAIRADGIPISNVHTFNVLGAQGWELVGVVGYHAYFKRPSSTPDALKGDAKP